MIGNGRHCLDCGEAFTRGREPAASRPLLRLPPSRVVPGVAVTLYGSVCGRCAGVTPESHAEAAQEGAHGAQASRPACAMPPEARALVRCTDCQHAAGLPYGRLCPVGKRHATGHRRNCQHFEPGT